MKSPNGWQKIAYVAGIIVVLGGAWTVLAPYTPWAPKITFSMAAENTRTRLFNDLVALTLLLDKAKIARDGASEVSLLKLIAEKREQMEELKRQKEKHK